jgi:hypothetical protein
MRNRHRVCTWFWIAVSISALASSAWAQAPKGKSGAAGKAARPAAAAAAKADKPAPSDEEPKADEAKGDEKKKAAKKVDLTPVTLPDPAVEAILETKPSTPSELVRAAKALADLRRPDLAKGFFQKVVDANLDPKALAALADEFGPAMFAGIASRKELAPEGKQVADAVLGAKIRQLQDPQRLAGLMQKLGDASPEVRGQAIAGLQEAGAAAVGPLMAVLADPQRAAEHASVRAALTALGPDVYGPLVAMLDASDPKLVVEAVRVLANLRALTPSYFLLRACCEEKGNPEVRAATQAAAKRIWNRVPDRQEAAKLLADLSRRYAQRIEPLAEDPSGQVVIGSWDDAKKQATPKSYQPDDAARWFAARFARDAYAILPERREMLLLHLAAMLEQAAYDHGLDKPLSADKDSPAGKVSALGAETVEDVLAWAMQNGQAAAATAAARILGPLPGADRLLHRTAQPCPLVLATRHPDRRLRLAAIEAVMRIKPRGPFPGASYVGEALGFMAASRGARRVLIASPRIAESMRLGAYLVKLGYETDTATTGRDLVRKALQSPDYEFLLIEAIVSYPTVDEVLQSLRRDGRTALTPVGVLAHEGDLERARHLVRNDPRAEAFPRPSSDETVRWQVEHLAARWGDMLPAAERKRHAASALDWLAQLSGPAAGALYDLSRVEAPVAAALAVPGLSAKACAVLGNLGTPESQQALVDLASRKSAPLAERKAALGAFRTAVQRRGILLTTPKIRLQYDRYNQSAQEDSATQAVLGMILDCIEAPTKPQKPAGRRAERDAPKMAQGGNSP